MVQSIGMDMFESRKTALCCPAGVIGIQGVGGTASSITADTLTVEMDRLTDGTDGNHPGL